VYEHTSCSCASWWACIAAKGLGAPCGLARWALAASSTLMMAPITLMLFIASAARAPCGAKVHGQS